VSHVALNIRDQLTLASLVIFHRLTILLRFDPLSDFATPAYSTVFEQMAEMRESLQSSRARTIINDKN
jgi:hypothetical protein